MYELSRPYLALVLLGLQALLFCAWSQAAFGQQAGTAVDLPIEECASAPKNGADALILRVKLVDGSYGVPVLVGIKDGGTLWSRALPDAKEINTAKSNAKCKGSRGREGEVIDISSQDPGNAPWAFQRFRWDGRGVKKLGEWVR